MRERERERERPEAEIPVVIPLLTCKSTDTVNAVHLASSFLAT
jgi:hypothetical protein